MAALQGRSLLLWKSNLLEVQGWPFFPKNKRTNIHSYMGVVVTGALNGMCMCVDCLGLLLYSTGPQLQYVKAVWEIQCLYVLLPTLWISHNNISALCWR